MFKLDRAGNETVLYTFTGGTDGGVPSGRLLRREGNLYGTTLLGGASGFGVLFKVDQAGNETVLYTFTGGTDGGSPQSGLIGDEEGNLYGTTLLGGAPGCFGLGCGVVFQLKLRGGCLDGSAGESSTTASGNHAAPPTTSIPAGRARMTLPNPIQGGPWYRIPTTAPRR